MDSFKNLSLDDTPPTHRLFRSMSFSEISPRKELQVNEKVISGPSGSTVYRQYSYHELGLVSGTTSLRYSQKFVSELHVDRAGSKSSSETARKNSIDIQPDFKRFVVPSEKISEALPVSKEGDLHRKRSHDSSDSNGDFKRKKLLKITPLSYSSDETEKSKTELKERGFIRDEEEDDKGHPRTVTQLLFVFVPLIIAILATFGTQYATYQKVCEATIDISASGYLLGSSIFGQEKAVKSIVETLRKFNSSEQNGLQVMVFTGGTGVGKTYTASLLEEIFPWKHNIHHFIMPIDFQQLPELSVQKYPLCGDHLVIMDDLRVEDIKDIAYIVSFLQKLAEKNKVIAVLIFKFHKQLAGEVSENEIVQMSDEVQTNLFQRDVNSIMIDFKTLEKNDVIQCIKEAMSRHWIPVSDQAVNTILEQVDYHSEGCKRISSKIAVVNELWVRQS